MKIFMLSIISFLWIGCNDVPSAQDGYTNPEGAQIPFQAEKRREAAVAQPEKPKPLIRSEETPNNGELEIQGIVEDIPIDNFIDSDIPLSEDVDTGSKEQLPPIGDGGLIDVADSPESPVTDERDTNLAEIMGPPSPEDIDVGSEEPLPSVADVGQDEVPESPKELARDESPVATISPSNIDEGQNEITIPPMDISTDSKEDDKIDRAVKDSVDTLVNNIVNSEGTDSVGKEGSQGDVQLGQTGEGVATSPTTNAVGETVTEGETDDDAPVVTNAVPSNEIAYVRPPQPKEKEDSSRTDRFVRESPTIQDEEKEAMEDHRGEVFESLRLTASSVWHAFVIPVIESYVTDNSQYVTDNSQEERQNNLSENNTSTGLNTTLMRAVWLAGNVREKSFLFRDDLYNDVFVGWYQLVNSQLSALMVLKIEEKHVSEFQQDSEIVRGDLMDAGMYSMYSNWTKKHIFCEDNNDERFQGSLVIFQSNSNAPLTYGDYMLDVDEFEQGNIKLTDKQSKEEFLLDTFDSDALSSLESSESMFSYHFKHQVTALTRSNALPCE